MQDAFGGIINMLFIVLFLLIVIGVLGLVVGYTKAFKMKNIIISHIENYESSGCFENGDGSACKRKMIESARGIGYGPRNIKCPADFTKVDNLFCYKEEISTNLGNHVSNKPTSYRIITQVDLGLPIITNIFGINFFQVVGDTRVIETKDLAGS